MTPARLLSVIGKISIVYAFIVLVLQLQLLFFAPLSVLFGVALTCLLFLSGVVTLQRKTWSHILTIVYAVLSLMATVYSFIILPSILAAIMGPDAPCVRNVISTCRTLTLVDGIYPLILLLIYSHPKVRAYLRSVDMQPSEE